MQAERLARIAATFARLSAEGRKGLIPYITSGHPHPSTTVPLMHAMVKAGADIIELGVPFSDPMADGPTIQKSNELALSHGIGLTDVLEYVAQFRLTNSTTPIVLMGYANPIERMGTETFAKRAAEVGVDGVLVVDYPPEEAVEFSKLLQKYHLDPIFLLAPTTTLSRIETVVQQATGYLYYVSLKGITGAAAPDLAEVNQKIAIIRGLTQLPIGVGFGIKDGPSARAIGQSADAVVIGSTLIKELEAGSIDTSVERATNFLLSVRKALDA